MPQPPANKPDELGGPTTGDVSLAALDLNLLVSLDVLLTERSVTGAAQVLHRSQPALSASLKRLRLHFRDDLLIRAGNRHELTPLAAQIKPRVAAAIADLERLFAIRTNFDPATASREFKLHTSDYGQVMLGRAIADLAAAESPGVRLRFLPLTDEAIANAEYSLRASEGFILPHGFIHGVPHTDAYTDRWAILVAADNELVQEAPSLEQLAELEWVLPYHRHDTSSVPAVRQLQLLGIDPKVAVACEGFLPLPAHLLGTNRATIIQQGLAHRIAPAPDFRLVPCPFEVVPLVEALWWHPSLEMDPGHRWLRSIVERAGHLIAESLE